MTPHADLVARLLRELVTLVRGECPALLNEDSGGDARLSLAIDDALAARPADPPHEYQLIANAVGERGKTDCSTPLYVQVMHLVDRWDTPPADPHLIERLTRERDEARKDAAFHADCRPNRREAEAAIADAKAMNDRWADEKARADRAEAALAERPADPPALVALVQRFKEADARFMNALASGAWLDDAHDDLIAVRDELLAYPLPAAPPVTASTPTYVEIDGDGDISIDFDRDRHNVCSLTIYQDGRVGYSAIMDGQSAHGIVSAAEPMPSWVRAAICAPPVTDTPQGKETERVTNYRLTRLEVIDESGRAYSRHGVSLTLSYQDDGRTLKVFVAKTAGPENPWGAPQVRVLLEVMCGLDSFDRPVLDAAAEALKVPVTVFFPSGSKERLKLSAPKLAQVMAVLAVAAQTEYHFHDDKAVREVWATFGVDLKAIDKAVAKEQAAAPAPTARKKAR